MIPINPPIHHTTVNEFAAKLGFGKTEFNVGDPVRHISFWYSNRTTNDYDLYKIEKGVIVSKKQSYHGFVNYDVQTYDENNKPSGKWVCVETCKLSR